MNSGYGLDAMHEKRINIDNLNNIFGDEHLRKGEDNPISNATLKYF